MSQLDRFLELYDSVTMLKNCIHISVLFLISVFLSLPAFASEENSYRNEEYSFSLEYPKILKMKVFGEGYFDILKEGNLLLRASIEDDTFKIFIQETKAGKDAFRSFARQRCRIICDADGPDGSTYCDKIENEKEWNSRTGLTVLEFTMIFTQEDYQNKTKEDSRMGPVFVVDISSADHPLALMIHPGHETLASKDSEQLIRGLIDTIELLPGNSDRQRETKVCGTVCKK